MANSKVGKRADKTKVVCIKNDKNAQGIPIMKNGETRLRKELERYTMTCDMPDCEGEGRYDEIGEVICPDCGRVISQDPERGAKMMIYPEDGFGGNDEGGASKGPSGNPYLRPPALRSPGPSSSDGLGGVS